MSLGLLFLIAIGSALLLIGAAFYMLRASDNDVIVAARFAAARGSWAVADNKAVVRKKAGPGLREVLLRGLTELGRGVMQSGVLPGRTRSELQQTLQSAGLRGPNSLAMFVGAKMAALFGLPLAGWLASRNFDFSQTTMLMLVGGGAIVGLLAPDMVIKRKRKGYLAKIEKGLSDALDLMVICAQAGLSLEPAMARVGVELRIVHPEMCLELETTVHELEIMADSARALTNLGKRTGLDSLQRLTSTLIQTMQYGTPLSDSLRTLSNEMRTAALTRFEERAARLPVMLTMPMIMFILPTVFMIVGGPAAIQIGRALSN